MSYMEKCVYSRIDRDGSEIKVGFSAEPLVFRDKCFMGATLGIGDCSKYFISFDHSIDSDTLNCIHIKMIQGMISSNKQKRYGAMLMSSLFEYMHYLEKLYNIKFSYVDGELTKEFKDIYYKQTGKKLTDFYIKAIEHVLPYMPNRKIELHYYVAKQLDELFGKDIERAGYFRYDILENGV